jgi:hypothetical protein
MQLRAFGYSVGEIAAVEPDQAKALVGQISRPDARMIVQLAMIGQILGLESSPSGAGVRSEFSVIERLDFRK